MLTGQSTSMHGCRYVAAIAAAACGRAAGPSRLGPLVRLPALAARPLSSCAPLRKRAAAPVAAPPDPPIPFSHVQVVDPVTRALSDVQPLRAVQAGVDPSTHAVRLVSSDPPIVRIVDLGAERQKAREHEAKLKRNRKFAPDDKEVQVGWGAAPGDLAQKAALARSILEHGDRVAVIFAPRAGAGQAEAVPERRRRDIVATFESGLAEVGKKWRDDDAQTGGKWICYWKAKDEIEKEVRDKVVAGDLERLKAKDEKKLARQKKEEERLRKARERMGQ